MAWPRCCHFKPRSAGEVKQFKCLASRKRIVPLINMYEVNWTLEKGIISLVNAGEVISNLERGSNPSRNSQKRLALGNGTSFHHGEHKASAGRALIIQLCLEAKLLQEAQRRSYLEVRSYTEVNYYNPRRTYSSLKARLKAKLNSTTTATSTSTYHRSYFEAVQSISKSEPIHCKFMKTLKGVLLTF